MNDYITEIASRLVLTDKEKAGINIEILRLKKRIQTWEHIDKVKDIKLFGSFKRDTILPREIDPESDVDVMVIFKDAFRTPKETFYDLLLKFAHVNYGEQILKDEPSIVLNLSGIKIELTTGVEKGASINLQIPIVNNRFLDWTWTDPFELIRDVEFYDKQNDGLLRPLIRLFKLWNVNTGHHYPSYKLEHYLSHLAYLNLGSLLNMFLYAATNLPTFDSSDHETVIVLKACVGMIQDYERRGQHEDALSVLKAIFEYN